MDRGHLAVFHGLSTLVEKSLEETDLSSGSKLPPLIFALEG